MSLVFSRNLLLLLKSIVISSLLYLNCASASDDAPIRVTFINPASPSVPFWGRLTEQMQHAADDLGIELKILYGDSNRGHYISSLLAEIESNQPPDVLIYIYIRQRGEVVLKAAEHAGVKSFIINSSVPADERSKVKRPRERFSQWIGNMAADDEKVGFDLANYLIDMNKQRDHSHSNLIALSGLRSVATTLERDKGLHRAVEQQSSTTLKQLVHTDWRAHKTSAIATGLLTRFPKTDLVWAASDSLALEARKAAIAQTPDKKPTMLFGGVDWSEAGLAAISDGQLDVSYGGHFMEGAWAMVLVHDYFGGADFAKETVQFKTELAPANQQNVVAIKAAIKALDDGDIDYRQFSLLHTNPSLPYDFSWEKVVAETKASQANIERAN